MFKKIRLYNLYRTILKENEQDLLDKFKIKIDRVGRMYTVINLPAHVDTYGPKDGPRLTQALLQKWLNNLDNYLIQIQVKELTKVETVTEIDEMNYLLVIRYSFINVPQLATIGVVAGTIAGSAAILTSIVLLLMKLIG